MQRFKELVSKIDTPLWLEILFLVLFILRIPSFFEPYRYGDEMIYLTLGQGIRQGLPLYSAIHDNKPPLLYLTAAISGNLFLFKAILAFWSLITVYFFWKLVSSIFPKKERLHLVSTIIFGLLTTIPLLEGNIVNAELFMIGPVIFSFYVLLIKKNNFKNLFFSGVLVSIAALFKIPAAFDLLGIIAFWLIFLNYRKFSSIKDVFFKLLYLGLGFIIPIALTFVWYYFAGSLKEYIVAAFLQNFGYVSSWKTPDKSLPFLVKNGPLLSRALIMFLGFFILGLSRKKLSKQFIFITAWLLATLFAVTLSERPYPHYFIQSVAPISLLLGLLFTSKSIEQGLVIIPLSLAFFVPFFYKFWYYPTSSYYLTFIKFATRQISKDDYLKSFSSNIPLMYKVSDFLNKSTTKDDSVFVWSSDSSTIYALSRRMPPIKYVADYHITDFASKDWVISEIDRTKPKFIVITPNSMNFPELESYADENYLSVQNIDSAKIWLYIAK